MAKDLSNKLTFIRNMKARKAVWITLVTLKWMVFTGLIVGFLGAGAAFGYVSALVKDDPVRPQSEILEKINENAITGFVYFNDDTQIGQLRSEEDRRPIGIEELPKLVEDAVLAIEDHEFYNHYGVNVKAFFRAVTQKLTNADVQTGGSTITQQVARRVFLTLDKSDNRKAKEIFLALRLERLLSKEQILLAYLNKIPYGNGSSGYNLFGIKAAAKGIFNIDDLNQLNTAQAAYLAGLPQLPSKYSAFTSRGELDEKGFAGAVDRMKLVLKRMLDEGKLTQAQYEEALAFDIKGSLAKSEQKAYNTYPYLMLEVERKAAEVLADIANPDLKKDTKEGQEQFAEAVKQTREELLRKGYHIYTTIDKQLYDEMHAISDNKANFTPDDKEKGMEQIAAIALDNKTGAILGMIEGRDFYKEQMNLATQMTRQPGSTMKPIAAYIPAIDKGAISPATVIDDVPVILKDGSKGFHLPENWDNDFHGLVTARHALNQSYNIPAIKVFLDVVGINNAWDFAKKLGITTLEKSDYAAQTGVIGGLSKGVTVEELTNAYSAIPNKGVFTDAFLIRKITDSEGKVVYEHQVKPTPVFSEETAYIITDMMKTVISSGTASLLKREFKYYGKTPVAGKTGSTQNDGDAWFIGYSPDITVGVWAGYDQQKHTLKKSGCSMSSELGCGTQRAMKIWAKVMNAVVEKKPDLLVTKDFVKPANIVSMTVSGYSGKLPNEQTRKAGKLVTDIFNKKFIPTEEDSVLINQKYVTFDGKVYLPQPSTPDDMVLQKTVVKRERPIAAIIKEIEAILPQLPANNRPSIDHYYPLDYENDAASEVDPRADDGQNPNPPGAVVLKRSGDKTEITFQEAGSADIVGYRLYKSDSTAGFQRVAGKVVLTGQDRLFTDIAPGQHIAGYYITAVDVAGRESKPSKAVYTDGHSADVSSPLDPFGVPSGGSSGSQPGDGSVQPSGEKPGEKPDEKTDVKTPPTAPKNVSVKASGVGIEIGWSANPKAEAVKRYDVYYSDKQDGTYKKLQSSESNKLSYYAIVYDGWYRVVAVNDAGESKASQAVQYTGKKKQE
ncbi:penicillin-binding protein 1A [Paenibacillus flagellatus]|uniref:Carboxypeptidase n=1 Tax=Paenibacillus flagellatus TaxID=2211139 RepID=A0A2V5KXA9_9BACL|nr:penicillin-binding protein 1A [Paenibacillus flagellatus]PYI54416.1 carboxypeptidase [Paenibacillus flagellatus]